MHVAMILIDFLSKLELSENLTIAPQQRFFMSTVKSLSSKAIEQKQIETSMMGHNSVPNKQKNDR